MFKHFLRTQTNASSSKEGMVATTNTTTTTDIATTTTESSAIGRGHGDRASPPLVLSASLRQSFDASAFLCSAFAVLSTTTTTTTATTARADESQQGGQGQVVVGGGDLQSQPIHHHPSSSFPLHTPLWHQEAHCPHDRMLLRKLMLGRIAECLRDDLSVSLTGTPYQLAIQPSMVPTQIPDLTNGGVQVINPFNIVVSLSHHCHITVTSLPYDIMTDPSYNNTHITLVLSYSPRIPHNPPLHSPPSSSI